MTAYANGGIEAAMVSYNHQLIDTTVDLMETISDASPLSTIIDIADSMQKVRAGINLDIKTIPLGPLKVRLSIEQAASYEDGNTSPKTIVKLNVSSKFTSQLSVGFRLSVDDVKGLEKVSFAVDAGNKIIKANFRVGIYDFAKGEFTGDITIGLSSGDTVRVTGRWKITGDEALDD